MKDNARLAVSLFCHGIRISPSCDLSKDGGILVKRRAGLGSGLEIIIPGKKPKWINVPVEENFVKDSPYSLEKNEEGYWVKREGKPPFPVFLCSAPPWYNQKTTSGTMMSRIGVLQGTSLGIYVGKCCAFWKQNPPLSCHFCATGINVGVHEESEKSVADVVETAHVAKKESHINFVHLNSGYQEGKDLKIILPFVKALKSQVGVLVGVQCIPPENPSEYEPLLKCGVDHFSLCYEFHDKEYFARYLPGKNRLGQDRFFRALEYLCSKMPKGSVSGEIIAGIEPKEITKKAIDYITDQGAFPTVCIFRPLLGTKLEKMPSPSEEDMVEILQYMALQCLKKRIPIGMVPNLEVSLIMTPDDARYLLPKNWFWYFHHYRLKILKFLAMPYFAWKKRRRSDKFLR